VSETVSCDVCGRTILKGERTRVYLTSDGERREVCELCRSRAEALRWVWAELADEERPVQARRRRRSLVGWLRAQLRARQVPAAGQPVESGDHGGAEPGEPASASRTRPDPAARGARVGRAAAIQEPETRVERAVSRFNDSDHARTVAGLTRTLGPPLVSVGAAAGSPSEVRITVAWELSWYQWGVDLGEPSRAVYEIDKGYEVSEIDAPARHWNAHAAEDGSLRLGAAPAQAESQPARTES
jgi:hypothetical protein